MKMDTSLLQSDPEALGRISTKYQDDNQVSFFVRVQKNIQYHRFVQIVKLILYLQLIFATAVVGCVTLSNYYSSERLNDNALNPPTPASDLNGGRSSLNLDTVPNERVPWRMKEADAIVSAKPSQNLIESAKFIVMVEDLDGNEKPTSSGKITFEVNEDKANKIASDLSKIEESLDNLDRQAKLPVPNLMSVISSSKIADASSSSPLLQEKHLPNLHSTNDIVSSDEENVSKYTFSDDLDDDQIIQLLIEKLLSGKVIVADTDVSSDSKSSADEIPLVNIKSKRAADGSSSESSSSSSSSESANDETPNDEKAAVMAMLAEIIRKMDELDCDDDSNENVTPKSSHADRVKSLRKRLVEGILKAPVPNCGAQQPTVAVDKCGTVSYRCPVREVENK